VPRKERLEWQRDQCPEDQREEQRKLMFRELLHRVVSRPLGYDLAQRLAGAKKVRRRLAAQIEPLRAASMVLDIGGGTGSVGQMWNSSTKYICLDIDPVKLQGFAAKNPAGIALLADAAQVPIADESIDVVLCTNVTHHLPDGVLERMIGESARVLKRGGSFVLSDAIWAPGRRTGRLIWRYDRGTFPRTADVLRETISRRLAVRCWDQFAIWHEYIICVAQRAAE
jgi:ubiquinone/menaquinone biosynthesis C-methylase UbiE